MWDEEVGYGAAKQGFCFSPFCLGIPDSHLFMRNTCKTRTSRAEEDKQLMNNKNETCHVLLQKCCLCEVSKNSIIPYVSVDYCGAVGWPNYLTLAQRKQTMQQQSCLSYSVTGNIKFYDSMSSIFVNLVVESKPMGTISALPTLHSLFPSFLLTSLLSGGRDVCDMFPAKILMDPSCVSQKHTSGQAGSHASCINAHREKTIPFCFSLPIM